MTRSTTLFRAEKEIRGMALKNNIRFVIPLFSGLVKDRINSIDPSIKENSPAIDLKHILNFLSKVILIKNRPPTFFINLSISQSLFLENKQSPDYLL